MGCLECLPVIVYKVLQGEKFCEISVLNSLWSVKFIIVLFSFNLVKLSLACFQRSHIINGGPNCRGVEPQWNKKYLLYIQTSNSGSLGSWCWLSPGSRTMGHVSSTRGAQNCRTWTWSWTLGWTLRFLSRVSAWPFLRWSLSVVRRIPNVESIDLFVYQGYSSCFACFCWTCYQGAIHKQKFKEEMIPSWCSK